MTDLISRAILIALILLVTACSNDKDKPAPSNPFRGGKSERELRLEADGLYKLARRNLDTADYQSAIQHYDQILLKYPFTDYATQAQLESVYAKYRAFDPEGAISTADRFIKEHPRHPAIDYVYYMRGIINFERSDSLFDWLVDSSRQDVSFEQKAFDDFGLLVQKFPASRYAGDARQRMIFLRNRIAEHELSVVKYYVRRGAYVAASKRAEKIIAEYPGAPIQNETLQLLEQCDRELGLPAQADEIKRLRETNEKIAKGEIPPPAPVAIPAPAPVVAPPAPVAEPAPEPAKPKPAPKKKKRK